MTWNVHGQQGPSPSPTAWKNVIVDQQAPVVGIQEICKDQIDALAQQLGYYAVFYRTHKQNSGSVTDCGEGAVSKYPVHDVQCRYIVMDPRRECGTYAPADCPVANCAPVISFMVRPGGEGTEPPVRVYNTHVGGAVPKSDQVRRIAEEVDRSGIARKVILGDFNLLSYGAAEFAPLRARGFHNVGPSSSPKTFVTNGCPANPAPSDKRDYVLVSGPIHEFDFDAPCVPFATSDHRPLWGDIKDGLPSWQQSWVPRGGTLTSSPGVSSWALNRLDVFVRGTDNGLWHRWSQDGQWGDWEPLGGGLASAPDAVSWGPNRIDVFARGTDDGMWHRWWDGAAWRGWEPLGCCLSSAPAAASLAPGHLDVFIVGTDGALYHKFFNGSGWSGWEGLGGTLTSDPAAVSWGPNRIDVFARGTDNSLVHKSWNGSWSDWESLGGTLTSGPAVASWQENRLDVVVRGTDNNYWHRVWDGDGFGWSGWDSIGGPFSSDPAAVSWGPNRIDVFGRGGGDQLWHKWYGG